MPGQPKLQRWIDLLAALLRRSAAADFATLRREVPDYADPDRKDDALMRMFERDKDELRALGVPIESVRDQDGNLSLYRLATRNFYLPFLQLAHETPKQPKRPRGPGYQSLPIVPFEPDELDAIARAGHRVAALGDAALAHTAMSALRKLGHDLPIPDRNGAELIATEGAPSAEILDALDDALVRRKRVEIHYHSIHRDADSARSVEPYGLAFLSGHWYLVARDPNADALRNFRVSRISSITVNGAKSQSADYDIPSDFNLSHHARSRQAWELGDAEQVEVTMRVLRENGFTRSVLQLGEPMSDDGLLRRFRVRRPENFALWILGFAGDAVIEAPDHMAQLPRDLATAALANYGSR